jgi:hypothetical protein
MGGNAVNSIGSIAGDGQENDLSESFDGFMQDIDPDGNGSSRNGLIPRSTFPCENPVSLEGKRGFQ